jgi:hypothetical protein
MSVEGRCGIDARWSSRDCADPPRIVVTCPDRWRLLTFAGDSRVRALCVEDEDEDKALMRTEVLMVDFDPGLGNLLVDTYRHELRPDESPIKAFAGRREHGGPGVAVCWGIEPDRMTNETMDRLEELGAWTD